MSKKRANGVLKGCGKGWWRIEGENAVAQVSGKLRNAYLEVVCESEIRPNWAVWETFLTRFVRMAYTVDYGGTASLPRVSAKYSQFRHSMQGYAVTRYKGIPPLNVLAAEAASSTPKACGMLINQQLPVGR